MNKKSLIIHLVIIIACVVIGGKLASNLATVQRDVCKSKSFEQGKNFLGINRFAADVQWMLFVNYCGTISSVNAENAPIVYKKLKAIIDNNPDFEQAYEIGSLMLSVETPKLAIEILQRACDNPKLSQNWKLPFLAGFIASHHLKEKDYTLAENFFNKACQRAYPPEPHVISALLRAKSQKLLARKKWKDIPVTSERQAFLCTLIDMYIANTKSPEGGPGIGSYVNLGKMTLTDRILSTAKSLMEEEKDNPNVAPVIETMKEEVFAKTNLCENCLSPYAAGDKFCSYCGSKVKVYGTCSSCGAVKKGKFCSECGKE